MSKSVFVTRKIPDVGIKMLREKGFDVDINLDDSIPSQEALLHFLSTKPYDAVLSLLTDQIDSKIFDTAPSVRLYANYATGYDNIDIVEAAKRGIAVTNAPSDVASEAVAEHTIALMLGLAARIVEADEFVRQGKYAGWDPMNFIGSDMLGKTLGLIGTGRIGSRVAKYAKGLGMKIIYTDVKRNENLERELGVEYVSLEELLKDADVVSIHVPLLDSTKHLMNAERLKVMKSSAFLINTARGPIVEERALVDALQQKIISGAALDVFEHEPDIAPELIALQNVILTPHIASASSEARDDMAVIAASNIIDFFDCKTPRNLITPPLA